MSSPITFSGFNSIDFGQILEIMMQAERAPMTTLEVKKSSLNTQGTAFTTLAGKLGALRSAIDALTSAEGFSPFAAASGDADAVGVSTTTGGLAGAYEVVVSELARAQVIASTTTYSNPDEIIATAGAIEMTRAGAPPMQLPADTLTGPMTVREFADAINAQANAPVRASVVQSAPGQYRMVLTGRDPGTANAFTLTSSLTGGAGLTFPDADGNGTYGDSVVDLAVVATDAALTVNNLPVTSTTNNVEHVVPGVTLTLAKKDPTKSVLVEVTESSEGARQKLEGFVKAYNDLVQFLTDQNTAATAGKSNIARDGMVRNLKASLRTTMQESFIAGGPDFTRLSTVGLEFEQTGTIKINAQKLSTALKASAPSVQALLREAFTAMKTQVAEYVKSGGLIQGAKDRLKGQILKIDAKLESMRSQLEQRRIALQREFTAADRLMTQLKGQSSSLQALGGQYRLF